jgi:CubicO group peptidase (beta-lactamase class C family)
MVAKVNFLKHLFALLGVVVMAISLDPSPALASTAAPLPKDDLDAFVSGVVADAMRQDHIAGVSVAVVQNGQPLVLKGFGTGARSADGRIQPDTPFRIGSISKTFTWIALMREVEKGRIRLEAPVNEYLEPALQIPDQGFKNPIRIRDLIGHTAGMEDLGFGQLFERDPAKVTSVEHYLARYQPARVREPGSDPTYCNYCAVLAGHIVARLEGIDYETVIDRDITGPLGMTATTFRDPRANRSDLPLPMAASVASTISDGFSWADGEFKKMPIELTAQVAPAGAGWSSAADMSRYMAMLLNDGTANGATIFGPSTAKAFRSPLLATVKGINGWDHGFIQFPLPGGITAYGHGGDTILFHGSMTLIPELALGVFIVTNTEDGGKLAERFPEMLVQHYYPPPETPQATSPVSAAILRPFVGTYVSTRRAYHGPEEFVDLLQPDMVSAGPAGLIFADKLWIPEGERGRFRQKGGPKVMFFDLKDGKAVRWRGSFNTSQHERASWWQQLTTFLFVLGLCLITAIGILVGWVTRRRGLPSSRSQSVAAGVQASAATVMVTSLTILGVWAISSTNSSSLMYEWPGPFMTAFVWSAVIAAVLSTAGILLLPSVWIGSAWSRWRRLRYSAAAMVFAATALLIGLRGGLEFWSI